MNNLDKQYKKLLKKLLLEGADKSDRTGTGTLSIFGHTIRHNMAEGFPLLTTKKMAVKSIMTELKWFLKGRTDIQYLRDNNCKIWDGDYEKSGRTDGTLGPIYGKQWRSWGEYEAGYPESQTDQLGNLIEDLKTNPDSRRLMVNAWNVGELNEMVLPPCHYGFQVYTRLGQDGYRYISLMWNQRSVDTFLGLPFNIASYGTLLLLLAQEVKMVPEYLIGSLGDVHLYSNHVKQAEEQLRRTPFTLPDIALDNVDILNGEFDYQILGYRSHSQIKAPMSN
jgi:thymidylate synthase